MKTPIVSSASALGRASASSWCNQLCRSMLLIRWEISDWSGIEGKPSEMAVERNESLSHVTAIYWCWHTPILIKLNYKWVFFTNGVPVRLWFSTATSTDSIVREVADRNVFGWFVSHHLTTQRHQRSGRSATPDDRCSHSWDVKRYACVCVCVVSEWVSDCVLCISR